MPRSYNRRTPDQRVADLDKKISDLKAKRSARAKRDDPVVREMQQLEKRLKRFIQLAHDNRRPDIANSAMGFRSMLQRLLNAEMEQPLRTREPAGEAQEA